MIRIRLAFVAITLLLSLAGASLAQVWAGPAGIEIEVTSKGRPVAGARVLLRYREAPKGSFAVLTDSKGRAAVVNLAPGAWNIEVSHEDYLSYVAAVTLEPGKKAAETTSFLQATGAGRQTIHVKYGKATGPIGTPVEAPAMQPRAADPIPAPAPRTVLPEPEPQPEPEPVELREPDIPAPSATTPQPTLAPPEPMRPPAAAPPVELREPDIPVPSASAESVAEVVPAETEPPAISKAAALLEPAAPLEPAALSVPEPEPVAPLAQGQPEATLPSDAAETDEPAMEPMTPAAEPVSQPGAEGIDSVRETPPPAPQPEPPAMPAPEPPAEAAEPAEPEMDEAASEPMMAPAQPTVPTPPAASKPAMPEPQAPEVRAPEAPRLEVPVPAPVAPAVAEPEPEPTPATPVPEPTPSAPSPSLRTFRDRTCPECKPGEWSAASVEIAGPLGSGEACPPDARDLALQAARRVARAPLGSLTGFAGPAIGGVFPTALELLPEESRAVVVEVLAWTRDSCRVLAVAIPHGAKFQGFRYEAADGSGQADCVGDQDCPIGDSTFLGNPGIERGQEVTVVYSVFENRSAGEERRARLTVYFVPAAGWRP